MEEISKKQKRFLAKWTCIMGLFCGIFTGIMLFLTGGATPVEYNFWIQVMVVDCGGGIVFGLYPSVLAEYRRS